MDGWMNECMSAWMHDCINAWMHGMTWQEITWNDMKLKETQLIKEWRYEWINEGMHEWMNELLRPRHFSRFLCEIELSLHSCALFVDHFTRSSRATAETETLLRRPRQPLYQKKCRVLRPRLFSSLNSRIPISHTSQLLAWSCMMMWLPWWLR